MAHFKGCWSNKEPVEHPSDTVGPFQFFHFELPRHCWDLKKCSPQQQQTFLIHVEEAIIYFHHTGTPKKDRVWAAKSGWNRGRWLFYLFGASYTGPDLPHVPGLIPGWYQGLQTRWPWWPASLCLPPCHPSREQLRGARRPKITQEF